MRDIIKERIQIIKYEEKTILIKTINHKQQMTKCEKTYKTKTIVRTDKNIIIVRTFNMSFLELNVFIVQILCYPNTNYTLLVCILLKLLIIFLTSTNP